VRDILSRGLRVVIVGTIAARHREEREHYYAGAGNNFWLLLHESGLTPEQLSPDDDHRLPAFGIGLTDLVWPEPGEPGLPAHPDLAGLRTKLARCRPNAIAFVSKSAATSYAQAAGERLPRDYGPLSWSVSGRPAFVLPGPSGANNGMPLPLRIALWRDLDDFLRELE
jgi:TDG/mug DNA glycosylase family protein